MILYMYELFVTFLFTCGNLGIYEVNGQYNLSCIALILGNKGGGVLKREVGLNNFLPLK